MQHMTEVKILATESVLHSNELQSKAAQKQLSTSMQNAFAKTPHSIKQRYNRN
jgi:hypothetical protein